MSGKLRTHLGEEHRHSFSPEAWEYLKTLEVVKIVELPPFIQPKETPGEVRARTYKNPSINNVEVGSYYLESPFGAPGLGRQLPESQGVSYGWTGRYNGWGGRYDSVRERFEDCKILVTYFVKCGDMVKIGQSNQPSKRLASLQTSNPQPLEMLLCLPNRMGFREEDLHYRFRNHRKNGEWFSYDKEISRFVGEKISLQKNPMDLSLVPTENDLSLARCGGTPVLTDIEERTREMYSGGWYLREVDSCE